MNGNSFSNSFLFQSLSATGSRKMMKFFYAIVEEAGSAFPVDIEPCETVRDLKKKIKDAKMYQFPADELQLFLAKVPKEKHVEVERREEVKEEVQEDMTWLSSRSEGVKKLQKGEKTPLFEVLTEEDQELQAADLLKDVLREMDPPSVRQIHVLVIIPPQYAALRSSVSSLFEVLLRHILTQAPTTFTERNRDFKNNFCDFYGCYGPEESSLRDMLLNVALPSSLVVASHLFRRSHQNVSDAMMQISDIDDVRNGLLLFKPLKHAFDHFHISFFRDDTDAFRLKVFDPSIRGTPLIDLKDQHGADSIASQ